MPLFNVPSPVLWMTCLKYFPFIIHDQKITYNTSQLIRKASEATVHVPLTTAPL